MVLEFGCWYPWRREDAGASSDFVSLIGALVKQECSVIRQAFFYMYIICNEKRKKKKLLKAKTDGLDFVQVCSDASVS